MGELQIETFPLSQLYIIMQRIRGQVRKQGMTIVHQEQSHITPVMGWRLNLEIGLFLILLVCTVLVRIGGLSFNTVFYDEALYTTLGLRAFNGDFSQSAAISNYASYLYPLIAAVVSHFGNETGLRLLSVALGIVTTFAIYVSTYALFGVRTALLAMALYGLSGASINMGQMILPDTLGIALIALAFYCIKCARLLFTLMACPMTDR
jgi:4-amino-4-deoxy-L-arabinose transferase-like glycosyltransferase